MDSVSPCVNQPRPERVEEKAPSKKLYWDKNVAGRERLPEANMELSDFQNLYDDDTEPYMYVCPRFVYKNNAQIQYDKEVEKAMAEYRKERSKNPSPFDAVARPKILSLCGGIGPLNINNDETRQKIISYSKLALDQYNDQNQDADFVFHDLVKSTYTTCTGHMYYITFQAKPKDCSNSDSPAITFQAQVRGRLPGGPGPPEVMSCAIKPT